MDETLREKILSLLERHRIMTLATVRPDGWPQATTVGFAHEGMTLYFLCGPHSQKAQNLAHDDRVSLTIDHDESQVMRIEGLSMAAHARLVADREEAKKAVALLMAQYPSQEGIDMAPPDSEHLAVFRVVPLVISVIDYTKGFAHTDLVTAG